jgi:uncharacterized protein (DUF433 family)
VHNGTDHCSVKGTRITVYDVLEYLAGGLTEDQILSDFPVAAFDAHSCIRSTLIPRGEIRTPLEFSTMISLTPQYSGE